MLMAVSSELACVGDGFYTDAEVEALPGSPCDYRIPILFAFPGTLQRMEREEAAARLLFILTISHGEWAGVAGQRIATMLEREHMLRAEIEAAEAHNANEKARTWSAKKFYDFAMAVTFGLAGQWLKEPPVDLRPVPSNEILPQCSCIPIFGVRALMVGFAELREQGLIRVEMVRDGDEDTAVYIPTAALLEKLARWKRL
jgi:hypothetical protein